MIPIERTGHAHARVDASPAELDGIKAILDHAVEAYDRWDLDYLIPGDAETRKMRLEWLARGIDETPITLHREDLRILLIVVSESDRMPNPHLDHGRTEQTRRSLEGHDIRTIFDDSWREQP